MLYAVAKELGDDNMSHVLVAIWRAAEEEFVERYGCGDGKK